MNDIGENTCSQNTSPVYKIQPGVILASAGDHVFLVSPSFATELNDTASFYWQYLKEGVSAHDLLLAACSRYDIDDRNALKKDIDLFLGVCIDRHLVFVNGED